MEKKRGRPRKQSYPTLEELKLQYQNTPMPIFFVNRQMEVIHGNRCAVENYRAMTLPDGLRSILPEGSEEKLICRLAEGRDFRVELPLLKTSQGALAFSPIREKEEVVGAIVMMTPLEKGPEFSSLAEAASSSAGALTGLLNDVVSQIASAVVPLRNSARFIGDGRSQSRFLGILHEVYRLYRASRLLEAYLDPCPGKDTVAAPVSWGVVDFWSKLGGLLDAGDILLEFNSIPFNFELPQNEVRVYCCFDRIALAVLAMIDNSFRYTAPNNQVMVVGENTSEGVRVKIIDKGRGIPPEELGKIFTPFYSRGASGEPLVGQSMGLGLTVARQIIYAHGGAMAIESTPEEGTTVVFTLPSTQEMITSPIMMKSALAYYLQDPYSVPHVQLHEHIPLPL